MGNILVPLGIIVGLSILSWILQQVKAASEEAKRQQAAPPPARRTGPKTGGSDIDRFLQEIDKLRQGGKPTPPKAAAKPQPQPQAKPAPQAKKVRLADQDQPTFKTTAAPQAATRPTPPRTAASVPAAKDDLPVATVVGSASGRPAPATIAAAGVSVATIATVARPADAGFRTAKTAIAAKVTGLLADPQSAALAVVLNEILGPPKCKKREG